MLKRPTRRRRVAVAAPAAEGAVPAPRRRHVLVRLLRLQLKLLLDGLRDVILSPISVGVAVFGLLAGRDAPERYFDALLRFGQRTDRWINLFDEYRGDASAGAKNPVDRLFDDLEASIARHYDHHTRGPVRARRHRRRQAPPHGPGGRTPKGSGAPTKAPPTCRQVTDFFYLCR